jgi:DnaA family protein
MHTSSPQQLLLDFRLPCFATFDHFIAGSNLELLTHLNALSAPWVDHLEGSHEEAASLCANEKRQPYTAITENPFTVHERTLYLWGDKGVGCSHLLQALSQRTAAHTVRLLTPQSSPAHFNFDSDVVLYALDDCHHFSQEQQIAAFHLFNQFQAHQTEHPSSHGVFIATGDAPPSELYMRDDLRSRLAWGRIFQVEPLNDEGKMEALQRAAHTLGFMLPEQIASYMLVRFKRDMSSLMALLHALSRFSLEQNRIVTLPLLRTFLDQYHAE